jgi:hypothetical protein
MAIVGEKHAYDELCAWTLSLHDSEFIHQHVVDAFAAQHAEERTKPIAITFALVGLYLHLERGFTGKRVQQAHMELAKRKGEWPRFPLPAVRGTLTAIEVIAVPAGSERVQAIDAWCASVWASYRGDSSGAVADLLQGRGIV